MLLMMRWTRITVLVVLLSIVAAACGTDAAPTDDATGVNAASSATGEGSDPASSASSTSSPSSTTSSTSTAAATAGDSATENPPAGEPPAEDAAAEEPAAEDPPAEDPPAEDPPAEDPPPDDPPADTRAPTLSDVIVEPGEIFGGMCSTEASVYASVSNETGVEALLSYQYLPTSSYGGFAGTMPVSVESVSGGIQLIGHVKNLPDPYPPSGGAQAATAEFRWTVTDAAGNTSEATATAVVGECEVVDTQAPVLSDVIVDPGEIFGGTCATQASVYAFVKNETNVSANLTYTYTPLATYHGYEGVIPVTVEAGSSGIQLIGHVKDLPDPYRGVATDVPVVIEFRWSVQDVIGNFSDTTVTADLGQCP